MTSPALSVLVVGAGPVGCYAARQLAAQGVQVALVNRDFVPGGMVTFGLHPSKQSYKKAMATLFEEVISLPNVHYFGGVDVGPRGMLALDELGALGFAAHLFAIGAQATTPASISGLPTACAYAAKDWLAHLQGMRLPGAPSFSIGARVAVMGTPDIVAETALALTMLEGRRDVFLVDHSLGLWLPGPRGCRDDQLRNVAHAIDPLLFANEAKRIESSLQNIGESPVTFQRRLTTARQKAKCDPATTQTSIQFQLLSSLHQVHSDGAQIRAIEFEHTLLSRNQDEISSSLTGHRDVLPVDTLLYALPDRVSPDSGIDVTPQESPEQPRYQFDSNAPCQRSFIAGWTRTPAFGLNAGMARKEGESVAAAMLQAIAAEQPSSTHSPVEALRQSLDQKGARYLSAPERSLLSSLPQNKQNDQDSAVFEILDEAQSSHLPKTQTPQCPGPIQLHMQTSLPDGALPFRVGQYIKAQIVQETEEHSQLQVEETCFLITSRLPFHGASVGVELYFSIEAIDEEQGLLVCSHVDAQWSFLHQCYKSGQALEVVIVQTAPEGIWVQLPDGSITFLPERELERDALFEEEHSQRYTTDCTLQVWVVAVRHHRIQLTTRRYTIAPLEVGDIVRGVVQNVGQYGISVQLEDEHQTMGLIPTHELSWSRQLRHPNDFFALSQGFLIHAQVKGFNWEGQPELSIKSFRPDPWAQLASRFVIGQTTNVFFEKWLRANDKDRGFQGFLDYDIPAFVIDVPMLTSERDRALYQLFEFKLGESLPAVIKDIDPENKRVFLSMLEASPELLTQKARSLQQQFQVGVLVPGRILSLTPQEATILLDGSLPPALLSHRDASDFLRPGKGLNDIMAPEQSVIVEIASFSLEQTLDMQLTLRGIGPSV